MKDLKRQRNSVERQIEDGQHLQVAMQGSLLSSNQPREVTQKDWDEATTRHMSEIGEAARHQWTKKETSDSTTGAAKQD